MRNYFEAEMRLLHEAAQSFAKAYPEQAGLLNLQNLRDRDPHIERLLEGVAYLTAQIRQRIDDDLPDISANLLAQLWPHMLRPVPAMTIVQFMPRAGHLQNAYIIPAQTQLQSAPLGSEQTVCQFQTTRPVKVLPLQIAAVHSTCDEQGGTCIKLHFKCDANAQLNQSDLSNLCFYLQGDSVLVLELFYLLTTQVQQIRVFMQQDTQLRVQCLGDNLHFKAYHLTAQHHIISGNSNGFSTLAESYNSASEDNNRFSLSAGNNGFSALQLLMDYFVCRDSYYFVQLQGLDKIKWPPHTQQFSIDIKTTSRLANTHLINEKNILLYCTPAVNLYQTSSEPINCSQQRTEYPLFADAKQRNSVVLFSVDSVTGIETVNGPKQRYEFVYSFKHRRHAGHFYSIFSRDNGGEFSQTYLQVGGNKRTSTSTTLSCGITVCNGHYPRQFLRERDSVQLINISAAIQCHIITRPTALLLPPKRQEWQWLAISQLALNYDSLTTVINLRQLLEIYDWSNREENRRRIQAIHELHVRPIDRIHRGMLMRGLEFCLIVHEHGFLSLADIYLFGTVLHQFLRLYTAINFYVALKMICHPSQRVFQWDLQVGLKLPI